MIKGQYWHTGTRADLIRSWPELPKYSGYQIMVVTPRGAYEGVVQVMAREVQIVLQEVGILKDSIGWFPR